MQAIEPVPVAGPFVSADTLCNLSKNAYGCAIGFLNDETHEPSPEAFVGAVTVVFASEHRSRRRRDGDAATPAHATDRDPHASPFDGPQHRDTLAAT